MNQGAIILDSRTIKYLKKLSFFILFAFALLIPHRTEAVTAPPEITIETTRVKQQIRDQFLKESKICLDNSCAHFLQRGDPESGNRDYYYYGKGYDFVSAYHPVTDQSPFFIHITLSWGRENSPSEVMTFLGLIIDQDVQPLASLVSSDFSADIFDFSQERLHQYQRRDTWLLKCEVHQFTQRGEWLVVTPDVRSYCKPDMRQYDGHAYIYNVSFWNFLGYLISHPSPLHWLYLASFLIIATLIAVGLTYLARRKQLRLFFFPNRAMMVFGVLLLLFYTFLYFAFYFNPFWALGLYTLTCGIVFALKRSSSHHV